jgi:hypothetical protein
MLDYAFYSYSVARCQVTLCLCIYLFIFVILQAFDSYFKAATGGM